MSKNSKNNADKNPGGNIPGDSPDSEISPENNAGLKDPQVDDFEEFFDSDIDDSKVEVIRIQPKIMIDGSDVSGFCGELYAGASKMDLLNQFGPGLYKIRKRNISTGRFMGEKTIRIAGSLRKNLDAPNRGESRSENYKYKTDPNDNREIEIDGHRYRFSDDLEKLKELILFQKTVNAAFPPAVDINSQLITTLLGHAIKEPEDPLARIESLAAIMSRLTELIPGKSGSESDGTMDLIREGMKTVQNIAALKTAPAVRNPDPGRLIGGPDPGLSADNQAVITDGQAGQEGEKMSELTILKTGAALIAEGFLQNRSHDLLNKILENEIPIPKAVRSQLNNYREQIEFYGEMALNQSTDIDDEMKEKFSLYLNKAVDIFIGKDGND